MEGELSREGAAHVKRSTRRDLPRERFLIELMTSDRELEASRKGSELSIYGT